MTYQANLVKTDINEYLKQHERKQLLRLLTCGSVDDGKSSLIGRLLHDSKLIYEDQLAAVSAASVKSGTTGDKVDLALLVDGLQAEREQGITIDVAYRYFSTDKRKFIIADTPGHEQYTRNMVTGASNCDLAIILIDATKGVKQQTKRHSFIASLLGIKHVIVAVNKMDLVDYDERVFNNICRDFTWLSQRLSLTNIHYIPLSALDGDNVVHKSAATQWYTGGTLMYLLENLEITVSKTSGSMCFPVQYVNRPNLNFRGYSGSVVSGELTVGKEIIVFPSMQCSKIKSILTDEHSLQTAQVPMAVTVTTEDEIDISRGDLIVYPDDIPQIGRNLTATLVWMSEQEMHVGKLYDFKHMTRNLTGQITRVDNIVDINNLELLPTERSISLNQIAHCQLRFNSELCFDSYKNNKIAGSFIIIDRLSNATVGCGMITNLSTEKINQRTITADDFVARFGHTAGVIQLIDTFSHYDLNRLKTKLFESGLTCVFLNDQNNTQSIIDLITESGMICVCQTKQVLQTPVLLKLKRTDVQDNETLDTSVFNV
ncbi:MAG: sulfate adenylyltransferase subunit CysN [Cycloclasticus sp.]|nr:sulfate adenylyltransferase subunit CysN [Cycloclasticus sp.]MBQ0789652.1 sulfate adenylyltransferase subunit CysN [Cycloclasticus sp.]